MNVPSRWESIDEERDWRNIPFNSIYSRMSIHVLCAYYSELDPRWVREPSTLHYDLLYLPIAGEGVIRTDGGDIRLKPGEAYLIPAGCRLGHRCDEHLGVHWCHFLAEIGNSFDLFELIPDPIVLVPDDLSEALRLHQKLEESMEQNEDWAIAERSAWLLELLVPFLRTLDIGAGAQSVRKFFPVLRYIKENLHQSLSLEQLAGTMNVSSEHFSRIFRGAFNTPPMHYVIGKRIQHAQELLCHTSRSVKEIGFLCGFSSPFHFSKSFKKHAGIPPGEYRQNHQSRLEGTP